MSAKRLPDRSNLLMGLKIACALMPRAGHGTSGRRGGYVGAWQGYSSAVALTDGGCRCMLHKVSANARSKGDGRAQVPLGLSRQDGGVMDCGLCGSTTLLTKAHVPAQMAGNAGKVRRARYVSRQPDPKDPLRVVTMGRPSDGGLWMYGLCSECNGVRQPPFERAYKDFAGQLKGLWVRSNALLVPNLVAIPDVILQPGAVARAVLIGMYAMNPRLRFLYPGVAEALVEGETWITFPPDLRLRFAIARGARARISGSDGGFLIGQTVKGKPVGFTSLGSIYFPPFAWQLVPNEALLIDRQRWANVSEWLTIPPTDERPFSTVCEPKVPLVMHPSHDPAYPQLWAELRASDFSESVECLDLPASLLAEL
jgi:hypothetical protein